MNQSPHGTPALAAREAGGSWFLLREGSQGQEFPSLCPEKTVPGLLCHLPRGSGWQRNRLLGTQGRNPCSEPAEIHTFIVGAVPSQRGCHGQVPAPGGLLSLAWLSTALAGLGVSSSVMTGGTWSWSQLQELCPQAPGTGENTRDRAPCPGECPSVPLAVAVLGKHKVLSSFFKHCAHPRYLFCDPNAFTPESDCECLQRWLPEGPLGSPR